MPDGQQVGSGYIEISPELDQAGMARTKAQIESHLRGMTRAVNSEMKKQYDDISGQFKKQIASLQQGKTGAVFSQYREEMKASQALEKQRQTALAKDSAGQQQRMRLIEQGAQAEIRARAKVQSAEEQTRAASMKAARTQAAEMDRLFKDSVMRGLGAQPKAPAGGAAGRLGYQNPLSGMASSASVAAGGVNRSIDSVASHLSQLSTRIGIASFQLQMLGGMLSSVVTGPMLYGFAELTKWGMGFAVATDQAEASLRAMLPAGYNVEALVGRLQKMAIASPAFNADDVVKYTSKLVAAGLSIGKTEKLMGSLSNIFATFGVSGASAELALKGISQVQQKGRAYAEELTQQIGEQIPIFDLLGKSLHMSQQELQEFIKKKKLTADIFMDALIKIGQSKTFIDGATNSVMTLGGAWQQFSETFRTQLGNAFLANKDDILEALEKIKPVVQDFINWFIKMIPVAIDALVRLVDKIREWKAVYDNLAPSQRELINQLTLIAVVAGPAAVAIGILGTALSTITNAAALISKVLAIISGGASAAVIGTVVGAILALAGAMIYLYNNSEPFRKSFLQILNVLKEAVTNVLLPAINRLWSEIVMLGRTLEGLGLKSEYLSYALYILLVPIIALAAVAYALVVVFKALWAVIFVGAAIFDGLTVAINAALGSIQMLLEGLAMVTPGKAGDNMRDMAKRISDVRREMVDLVDTTGLYNKINGDTEGATDGLRGKLNDLDFTATGLGGSFDGLNFSLGGMNSTLDASGQKWATLADGIVNARAAMDGNTSAAKSAKEASDSYQKSVLNLKDSLAANGKTLKDNSKEGQANRDAFKAAAAASYEMMLQDIRSGVPMQEAINRHKARTDQLVKETGKNRETQKTAKELVDTYGKVPKDVATLLKLMGYTNIEKAMDQLTINQMALQKGIPVNEAKRQYEKDKRLAFMATGGIVRGPGGPTEDRVPAMLSNMEYVIRAASARRLGKSTLDWINQYGELPPMFAKGGSVEWPYPIDLSKTKIPTPPLGGGPMGSGGMGWQAQMRVLRAAFPGLAMISGFREGAMTSTGNRSYHSMGRAVDIPPIMKVFDWIRANYKNSTRELIHTPAGSRQVKNGQDHVFHGGTIQQDHYDHIHWAHDNGGYIKPGQPYVNNTGKSELALNAAQGRALEDKIRNSDRPVSVTVYVDGVRRDAEVVFDEKADELIRALGGV